jgi:hypothetical protein
MTATIYSTNPHILSVLRVAAGYSHVTLKRQIDACGSAGCGLFQLVIGSLMKSPQISGKTARTLRIQKVRRPAQEKAPATLLFLVGE